MPLAGPHWFYVVPMTPGWAFFRASLENGGPYCYYIKSMTPGKIVQS